MILHELMFLLKELTWQAEASEGGGATMNSSNTRFSDSASHLAGEGTLRKSNLCKISLLGIFAVISVVTSMAISPLFAENIGPSGGGGGHPFDDGMPKQNAIISQVLVRSGTWIDGIQIMYGDKHCGGTETEYHGGTGGQPQYIDLRRDEYISGISGRYGNYIDKLQIHISSTGKEQGEGARDGRVVAFGGTGGHTNFSFEAPKGTEVIGFIGRSATYLDAIGIIVRPRQWKIRPLCD